MTRMTAPINTETRQQRFQRNRDRLRREAEQRNYQPRRYTGPGSANHLENVGGTGAMPQPLNLNLPTGSRGGGRGYGGGGGGGGAAASAQTAAALRALLGSDMFKLEDYSQDRQRISDALGADRSMMNDAYNARLNKLMGMENPYQRGSVAAPTKQASTYVDYLRSQGVDPSNYLAQVGAADAEGAANAAQHTNARQLMADAFAENLALREQGVGEARQFADQSLSAQGRAMEQLIAEKERQDRKANRTDRNALIMQLVQAMAGSGKPIDTAELVALVNGG